MPAPRGVKSDTSLNLHVPISTPCCSQPAWPFQHSMRKSSRKSVSSERYIAPPDDGVMEDVDGDGPDLQAEARRQRAAEEQGRALQKRVAVENKAARRRSRRRASVEALEGGAVAGGAAAGGAAPPPDVETLQVEEAGSDVKAEARRRRKSSSFNARERLRKASTVAILTTVGTRRRASAVDALEGGGAVAGGAVVGGAVMSGAPPPADDQDAQAEGDAARALRLDRRREEAEAEAAARAEAEAKVEVMLVELRKIGSIAAVSSQRARLWAGRHHGPQPQL